jgi:hypothetical protein
MTTVPAQNTSDATLPGKGGDTDDGKDKGKRVYRV